MRNLCKFSCNLQAKLPAFACNKARKLRVTSLVECRLVYVQFAGEFTRGVIAVLPAIAGILDCNDRHFCLKKESILAC